MGAMQRGPVLSQQEGALRQREPRVFGVVVSLQTATAITVEMGQSDTAGIVREGSKMTIRATSAYLFEYRVLIAPDTYRSGRERLMGMGGAGGGGGGGAGG